MSKLTSVEIKQTSRFKSWVNAFLGFALLMLPAFAQAAGPVIEVLGVDGNSITHNSPATVLSGTDFGDQAKDSTITRTFTIRNSGDSPLLVDGFRQFGDNEITFSVLSETLESGETNTFTATFFPESLGSFNTKCRITATDENYDDVDSFDANFAGFSYSISATNGPYGGGNQVDIEGASEGTVTSVTVGGKTSTFTINNNTVRVTMPKADGIGAVDIVVSSDVTRTLDYTYVPQELTLSNFTATNKVYDGTTAAFSLVSFDDNRELNDTLNFSFDANFADSNVATGKTISVSNVVISGSSSTNYTLVTTHGSTTADITLAPLTVTAENKSKTYDKSVLTNFTASYSGLVNGETNTVLGGTLVYSAAAQALAGTYTNTPSGLTSSNYDITFTSGTLIINQRILTIGGTLSVNDKIYDGTTTATGTVSGLTITSNLITADDVTLTDVSLEFTPDKTVGSNKTIQVASAGIQGADKENYTLSLQGSPTTTASITPKTVTATGLTALDRFYNNTTTVTITGNTTSFTGVIGADDVTMGGDPIGSIQNKNRGSGKPVTVSGLSLSGSDAGNYVLAGQPVGLTVDIFFAKLTVDGLIAQNKEYDGATSAVINDSGRLLVGVFGADVVSISNGTVALVGSFEQANVGTNLHVATDVGDYELVGADKDNYEIDTLNEFAGLTSLLRADITKAVLFVGMKPMTSIITYGEMLSDSRLSWGTVGNEIGVVSGTWAWDVATSVPNAGTNDWSATFTANDSNNYQTVSSLIDVIVNKANVSNAVGGVTVTYDGNGHSATGAVSGLYNEDFSSELDLGASYTNVPGGAANWSFAGTTNYNSSTGLVQIVINKADATLAVDGVTAIYDRLGHGATGTVVGVQSEDLSGDLDLGASFTNVPGGTANWAFADTTGNYNSDTGSVRIVINKAKPTATVLVTNTPVIYTGNAQVALVEISVSSVTGSVSNVVNSMHTNAGTYAVTASFVPNSGNYQTLTNLAAGNFVINKADSTISVGGVTVSYDGTGYGATGMVIGVQSENLSNDLDLGASFTNVPGGIANWAFTDTTGNYNSETGSVQVVINKADAAIYVGGVTVPYDGSGYGATGLVMGVQSEDLSNDLDLGASFTNVPGGTANWAYTDTTGNYNSDTGSVQVVINKVDPTINVGGVIVTYDGAGHGATGTVIGVNSEDLTAGLTLGASFTNAPGGTANWTFAGTNYNSSTGSVEIVINKVGLTLSGLTAQDRSYDQTTKIELLGLDSATLLGAVGGDKPQIDVANSTVSGSIPSIDSGTSKLVTVDLSGVALISPEDANYSVTGITSSITVTIDPRWLKADGLIASNKVYDATTDATIDGSMMSLEGLLLNDVVTVDSVGSVTEGTFADANVATNIAVTPNLLGVVLSGADAGNYRLNENYDKTLIADITEKTLTVVDLTGVDKVYNGLTNATASGAATLDGVISPDVVNLAGTGVFSFVDFNVASNITINTTGFTLGGAQAGNYSLTHPTLSAAITPKSVEVTGLTGDNKVYDGGTIATVSGTDALDGVLSGDIVALDGTPIFNFVDPNVGTNITINTTGYVLDGDQRNNYSVVQPTMNGDITPAELTVRADGKNVTYGDVKPVLTYAITDFVNNETTNVVSGSPTLSTTYTNSTVVSNSPVAITVTAGTISATNYTFAFSNGVITVDKAELLVTPANANVIYGDATPALTYELTGFKNSDTTNDVSGAAMLTTTYNVYTAVSNSPVAITASNGTLAADNYSFAFTNGLITVGKAELLITPSDTNVTYGAEAPEFTYSLSGFKNLESTTVVIGAPTLTSTYQAGDSVTNSPLFITATSNTLSAANYMFEFTNGLLTIDKAWLLVSAEGKSVTYGDVRPTLTYEITNFVNNETISVVSGVPMLSTTYTNSTVVSNSPVAITVAAGTISATNYTFAFSNGVITVDKAELLVTPANANVIYGDATPALTYELTGFKNSDTTNDVSGAAMLTTTYNVYTAVSNSPVAITASNGTLAADNYSFAFTNGLITVGKAELLITPSDTNVTYGAEAPEFTYSLSGFKNLESTNVVIGAPTLTSTYQAGDSVTNSPLFITATSNTLSAANYMFDFTNGLLTIDKAGLLVSADDKEVTYGEAATGLTYKISGFVLQETASVVSGTASNWTTYVAGDSVTNSPVDIMVANGDLTATNYSFGFTNGLLTVKAAGGLSIEIVNNPTKTYDGLTAITNLSTVNYQMAGFVYSNESFTVTQPNGTFENKNIGTNKAITVSLSSNNYAGVGTDLSNYVLPTNAVGTGAIVPASLSVSVTNNPSKVYDGFVAITNLVTTNYVVNGLALGDSVEINQTLGEFTNKNVVATNGVVVVLAVSNYTAMGSTDLGNYQLPTQAMGIGSITPAELSVSITNNPTKLADGTTVATLVPTNFVVEGLVMTNEGFTVTQTNGLYALEKAGTRVVTATLSSSDFSPILATLASNYSFPTNTTGGKTGTILPNVLNQFVVSGIADPIAAGVTGSVTVTAYDAYDNLKTDYTGSVTFASSDTNAAIVLPVDFSFMESDSGTKTFSNSVMLATVGNWSVSAIDSNAVITGSQTNIVVTPGAIDHVKFDGSSFARAGQGEFSMATVYDRFNNVATYYTGSKSVSFSGARDSLDPFARPFAIVNSKEIELGSHANVSFISGTLLLETVFYKAETVNLRLTLNTDQISSEGHDLMVDVVAGNAHKILWVQQPTSVVNKDAQWNSFSLEVTDYWANRTPSSKAVTVTPSVSAFSGGTNPGIASNGLVTFSDLTYGSIGTVTLVASASGLVDSPQSDEVIVESIRVIVTFDQQGGGSPVPGSKEVVVDAEYGALAEVAKEGYQFKGWYTQTNQNGVCVLSNMIVTTTSNHRLYAGWESLAAEEYALSSITVNSNSVEVTFGPSDAGYVYELQVSESLTTGTWIDVGEPVEGPNDTLIDPDATRPNAYYRIFRDPKQD